MLPAFKRVLDNAPPVNTAHKGKVEVRKDFTETMEEVSAVYSAKITEIMGEVTALAAFFGKLLTLGPDDEATVKEIINALPDNAAEAFDDAMAKVAAAAAVAEATAIAESAAS